MGKLVYFIISGSCCIFCTYLILIHLTFFLNYCILCNSCCSFKLTTLINILNMPRNYSLISVKRLS